MVPTRNEAARQTASSRPKRVREGARYLAVRHACSDGSSDASRAAGARLCRSRLERLAIQCVRKILYDLGNLVAGRCERRILSPASPRSTNALRYPAAPGRGLACQLSAYEP